MRGDDEFIEYCIKTLYISVFLVPLLCHSWKEFNRLYTNTKPKHKIIRNEPRSREKYLQLTSSFYLTNLSLDGFFPSTIYSQPIDLNTREKGGVYPKELHFLVSWLPFSILGLTCKSRLDTKQPKTPFSRYYSRRAAHPLLLLLFMIII